MQFVHALTPDGPATLRLPGAARPVGIAGIVWGLHEEICTPAYWAAQTWHLELEEPDHYRLGETLEDELLACLLGGYGIPAEIGLAAYRRLAEAYRGGIDLRDCAHVESLLRTPLHIAGRAVRYRFAAQKARYVAAAMAALPAIDRELPDRALRDALTGITGIGPKTASWIVRNWRASDDVSILDIHILRAGRILGIFDPRWSVERNYHVLERAYLDFALKIGCRASILDSAMWTLMRVLPSAMVKRLLERGGRADVPRATISSEMNGVLQLPLR
ncbi:8-oxoguanine DNA glycosylase [Sphingopyxis terrae subsp. ummariensis]